MAEKALRALKTINKSRWLYIMCIPGLAYFIVFRYLPMWGVTIAFQDYNIYNSDLTKWIGFKHFTAFFTGAQFRPLLVNTLLLSFYSILFAFPAPVILALFLNEIRLKWFKNIIQTAVYMPHFVSWVIVASISFVILNSSGPINGLIKSLGGSEVGFLTSVQTFRPMIIIQTIWKESGWGTIVFLAALAGVDMEQYEAAIVDGAGRFRQVWHITLPAIRGTIVILLILRMGSVLDNGFDQLFLMGNAGNRAVAEVIDTYTYRIGISGGQFSATTAIGLFKSLIGMILIFGSNWLAKKTGESGIF